MKKSNGDPLIGQTEAEERHLNAQKQFNDAEMMLIARAGLLRNVQSRVSLKLQHEMYPVIVEAATDLAAAYDELADAAKVAQQYEGQ